MKFKLTITMDNAAFEDANNGYEVARILRELANRIEGMELTRGDSLSLRDSNGNTVGSVTVS